MSIPAALTLAAAGVAAVIVASTAVTTWWYEARFLPAIAGED